MWKHYIIFLQVINKSIFISTIAEVVNLFTYWHYYLIIEIKKNSTKIDVNKESSSIIFVRKISKLKYIELCWENWPQNNCCYIFVWYIVVMWLDEFCFLFILARFTKFFILINMFLTSRCQLTLSKDMTYISWWINNGWTLGCIHID
jgi:hypothetical protein